jgi:2-keto-4-pentenoate hydratase/2-oxohepta-3-ene-1,7-dioic acid hydratase in catechol pathway
MRLGLTSIAGEPRPVAQLDGRLLALQAPPGATLLDLIVAGQPLSIDRDPGALDEARLLAPLRPPKIVAIGLNYLDHIREANLEAPKRPLVFTKFTTSVIGDGDEIVIDRELSARVDWEVELAAVIGRRMSRVSTGDALDHVFGYTVANDVSARDLQFSDGQWVRAKSLDTFCPLGPVIVTADEVPDPQRLALGTRVNGETVQSSNTSEMLFGVAELLSFCSHSFVLEPGDVVLTGTPWGCGEFMSPSRSLQAGDIVEVEVEGIGTLRNRVVELG